MRRIQAYFKNESNAESAKASLNAMGATIMDMGPLEAPLGRNNVIITIPSFARENGVGLPANGNNANVPVEGVAAGDLQDDYSHYMYAATIEVTESDLQDVLRILANNHARMKPFDDEPVVV